VKADIADTAQRFAQADAGISITGAEPAVEAAPAAEPPKSSGADPSAHVSLHQSAGASTLIRALGGDGARGAR
jgi:hypothetical protein